MKERVLLMKINHFGPMGMNPYRRMIPKTVFADKGNAKDQIEISVQAKKLQQQSIIHTNRQVKIAELKNKIDNGTYQIDPQQLAQKIHHYYFGK